MARAIDGDELLGIERLLDTGIVRQSKTASWLLDQVLHDIQAMPALTPPNEWVSVEERLPAPTENPVLVYDCTGVNMAWYSYAMGWKYRTGLPGVEITHWMPLPAPPEKE